MPTLVTANNDHKAFQAELQAAMAAHQAGHQPALPPGLDTEIFDPEQLEYLADYYQGEVLRHLRLFYQLLRATSPGCEPTAQTVGLNAALLARIFDLSEEVAGTSRAEMAKLLGVRQETLRRQFRAVARVIRELSPRSAAILERRMSPRTVYQTGQAPKYDVYS